MKLEIKVFFLLFIPLLIIYILKSNYKQVMIRPVSEWDQVGLDSPLTAALNLFYIIIYLKIKFYIII